VAGRDQFFRDVADKQKDLRRLLGLDEETLPRRVSIPAATGFPTSEVAVVKEQR